MNKLNLTPIRPHLFNAYYAWFIENDFIPQILVNATKNAVKVPLAHVNNGKIVLNISPSSIGLFSVDNESISFEARFNKKIESVYIPFTALEAIFARDTEVGFNFPPEEYYENSTIQKITPIKGSHLRIVE